MHEVGIAQSIVDTVEARASEHGATRVTSVWLRVGEASGIDRESIAFCYELAVGQHPMLSGSRLVIDVAPHRAQCRRCDRVFPVEELAAVCPDCGEWSDQIISGTELQLVDIEIETPEEVARDG